MNAISVMAMAGLAAGTGVALIYSGLRPPRPALAQLLDGLAHAAPAPVPARRRLDIALAAPLSRLGFPRQRTRQDLDILDRDPAEYLAQQVVAAIAGTLLFGLAPMVWGLSGQLPLWLAAGGALLAARFMARRMHLAAATRREQMRDTLSTLLDLAGGILAGGAGVEQALDETMQELSGWAAARIRRELFAAAQTRGRQRIRSWTALADLGSAIGVDELAELAAAIEQAASGSPVAEVMSTVAHTLRARITADMERAANARSAQMSIPIMLYGVGYLIFLLYAAMHAISVGMNQ